MLSIGTRSPISNVCCIGCQGSTLPQKLGIPIHICSKCNFDDMIHAQRGDGSNPCDKIRIVDHYVVRASVARRFLL